MKAVLHLKFIVLYIIFGFLCVFTTATLTTELITERLEKDTSQTLYREATMIADNYLPSDIIWRQAFSICLPIFQTNLPAGLFILSYLL